MKWTREVPTVAGWYWWREKSGAPPTTLLLEMQDGEMHCMTWEDAPEDMGGEWYGPLEVPHG